MSRRDFDHLTKKLVMNSQNICQSHTANRAIAPEFPLNFGNTHKGFALGGELGARMEQVFRADLSSIRVHVGDLPESLGVDAFAHGTDLYFNPHCFEPDSCAGEAALVHELVHVFQQTNAGRLDGASGYPHLIWNQEQEYEAEFIAANYKNSAATESIGKLLNQARMHKPTTDAVCWNYLQPNVHVIDRGRDVKLTDANQAMKDILDGINDHEVAMSFMCSYLEIKPVLEQWIKSSRVLWKRWITSRNERTVAYDSWESLARALLGEVRSEANLRREDALAAQVVESGYVNDKLTELLAFINNMLQQQRYADVRKKVFPKIGSYSGKYSNWYPHGGIQKCFTDPVNIKFKNRIAALHDIVEIFGDFDGEFDSVPDDKCKGTMLVPNGVRGYNTVKIDLTDNDGDLVFRDGHLGSRHCTLKEECEIIMAYRRTNMPTGFGPSFTTGRTLQFCRTLCSRNGAEMHSKHWLNACAWGLFAFWNIYYEFKFSRSHRFHEVMDMANNYGVPWTPYSYPNACPDYSAPFPLGNGIV